MATHTTSRSGFQPERTGDESVAARGRGTGEAGRVAVSMRAHGARATPFTLRCAGVVRTQQSPDSGGPYVAQVPRPCGFSSRTAMSASRSRPRVHWWQRGTRSSSPLRCAGPWPACRAAFGAMRYRATRCPIPGAMSPSCAHSRAMRGSTRYFRLPIRPSKRCSSTARCSRSSCTFRCRGSQPPARHPTRPACSSSQETAGWRAPRRAYSRDRGRGPPNSPISFPPCSSRIARVSRCRGLGKSPPAGGVSVYPESIPLTPELVRAGVRMLDALDWQGVAMIECKRDAHTGKHVLMEVNARLWGSLQLAIDAGVDFPALLARCVQGEEVPLCHVYRTDVRSRWFWGDVDNLLLRLRDRAWRRGAVRDFLNASAQRDRTEVWRWRDPLPFLVESLQWLGVLTRGTAGARRKSRAAPTECVPGSAVP